MAVETKQPHSRTCRRPQAGPQAGPRTSGGPSPRQVSATSRALPESLDKVPVYPIDGERVEIISPQGTRVGPPSSRQPLAEGRARTEDLAEPARGHPATEKRGDLWHLSSARPSPG